MEFKTGTFQFLKVYQTVTLELLELLKKNIIGTPGISMLYQHMQVEKKVRHIAESWFVVLEKRGFILGTCCFCARKVFNFGTYSNSYYLRYFTLKNQYRTSGLSKRIKTKKNGVLREEIEQALNGKPSTGP